MQKWIQDQYKADVITLTLNLGQQHDNLEEIRKKALKFGAKKANDNIYFVDATHPQHNNMPFYGWIYKGAIKQQKLILEETDLTSMEH